MVKKQLDFTHLRGHVLNHLIPEIYSQIVKENKIAPIINPRVEIITFAEDQDAELKITLVEKPPIKIGDYKKGLADKITQKAKEQKSSITTADQTDKPIQDANTDGGDPKTNVPENQNQKENKQESSIVELLNDEIVDVVVANSTVELPDILIEEETNRMITGLVDQITRLGLNLEQYLQSVKKSPEELRADYQKIATQTLHADFAITQIAIDNNYSVDDAEIDTTINAVTDPKAKEELSKPEQRIYIRAILTKAKTLNKLAEYAKECYTNTSKK